MSRAVAAARRFYRSELDAGEEVLSVHNATAAGTGSKIGLGALIGALVGWLYAVFLDSSLLAPLVLGALAGEMVGYFVAERQARRADGPGTIHLQLVLTSQNLLTVGRFAARRRRVLRRYPLEQIVSVATRRYPVAKFHLQEITMTDGTCVGVVVEGAVSLTP